MRPPVGLLDAERFLNVSVVGLRDIRDLIRCRLCGDAVGSKTIVLFLNDKPSATLGFFDLKINSVNSQLVIIG
jgi:hypothetical protein